MVIVLKKFLFIFTINSALLLLLIIGIQNSTSKSRVNFIIDKSVELPIGFIVGLSFISGSISGSLITSIFDTKDNLLKEQ